MKPRTCGVARKVSRLGTSACRRLTRRFISLAALLCAPAAFATDFTLSISTANSARNEYGSYSLAGSFSSASDVVNGCVWMHGGGVLQNNAAATLIDNCTLSLQSPHTVQPSSTSTLNGGWTATFPSGSRIDSFLATEQPSGDLQITIVNFAETQVVQFLISSPLASQLTYAQLADLAASLFQSFLEDPMPAATCSPTAGEASAMAVSVCDPMAVTSFTYSCAHDSSVSLSFTCASGS